MNEGTTSSEPMERAMSDMTGEWGLRLPDAVARLSTCRSVPADVVTLADEAPGLTDDQLRARQVAWATLEALAARQRGGERR